MTHENLTAAWHALQARAAETRAVTLRALRDADPARGSRFSREAAGLYLDFSRQRIDADGLRLLASLADAAGLRSRIEAMWRGDPINTTEGRAVLHTALRVPGVAADGPGGADIAREVLAERERMLAFAENVRSGTVRGSGGASFTTVVNIGIGGSDLGPAMAVEALHPLTKGAPRVRFVSNVDGTDLANVLEDADPWRPRPSARRKRSPTRAVPATGWRLPWANQPCRRTSPPSRPTRRRWTPSASTLTTAS
jgi:glucose-6-phosphate isomerase